MPIGMPKENFVWRWIAQCAGKRQKLRMTTIRHLSAATELIPWIGPLDLEAQTSSQSRVVEFNATHCFKFAQTGPTPALIRTTAFGDCRTLLKDQRTPHIETQLASVPIHEWICRQPKTWSSPSIHITNNSSLSCHSPLPIPSKCG